MAHRADQILDAVVAKLTAAGIQGVAKHRELSYDPAMELPAISVKFGPDQPPGISNIPIIDSVLTVRIVAIVREATEAAAVTSLLALRTSSHIALQADQTLGLSFVSDTRYGGATEPVFDTTGEGVAARQETQWNVPYRMNVASPE